MKTLPSYLHCTGHKGGESADFWKDQLFVGLQQRFGRVLASRKPDKLMTGAEFAAFALQPDHMRPILRYATREAGVRFTTQCERDLADTKRTKAFEFSLGDI